MAEKHTIVLSEDLDGFLGYDSDTIELIDIDASINKYEELVTREIQEIYPELIVEFNWDGGNGDWGYLEQEEGYEYLGYDLEDLESRVYNNGEFWVDK